MRRYSLYIFDLDGTLNRGDAAIPFAVEVVEKLRTEGANIRYVTNNATQTKEYFVNKLTRLGFQCEPNEVESSATATAVYCVSKGIKTIGVVGEPGLVSILSSVGIKAFAPDEDWPVSLDAVVTGLFRTFSYAHISKAMQYVRSGSKCLATNRDPTFPLEGGKSIPGAGVIASALETCTGVSPVVLGKPNPFLTEIAMKSAGNSPSETLVVGDRMDTDIESGKRAGANTFLVLTGVTQIAPEGQLYGQDLRSLLA